MAALGSKLLERDRPRYSAISTLRPRPRIGVSPCLEDMSSERLLALFLSLANAACSLSDTPGASVERPSQPHFLAASISAYSGDARSREKYMRVLWAGLLLNKYSLFRSCITFAATRIRIHPQQRTPGGHDARQSDAPAHVCTESLSER